MIKKKRPHPIQYHPSMGITQSIISKWQRCHLACALSLEGWEHKNQESSPAMEFGNLFHKVLEINYTRKSFEIQPVIEKYLNDWTIKNIKQDYSAMFGVEALVLFNSYMEHYKNRDDKLSVMCVEQVVETKYEHHNLRGKIDLVVKTKDGTYWIMDHKIKSRIDEAGLGLALSFDFQGLFYAMLFELLHPEIRISGCVHNIIRHTQIKQTGTLVDFGAKLRDDINKRPEYYFIRNQATYTDELKEQFKRELLLKLNDFEEWCHTRFCPAGGEIYRNEFACLVPGRCEYLDCCSAGGSTAGYSKTKQLFRELKGD